MFITYNFIYLYAHFFWFLYFLILIWILLSFCSCFPDSFFAPLHPFSVTWLFLFKSKFLHLILYNVFNVCYNWILLLLDDFVLFIFSGQLNMFPFSNFSFTIFLYGFPFTNLCIFIFLTLVWSWGHLFLCSFC